jgi:hypothetical protein
VVTRTTGMLWSTAVRSRSIAPHHATKARRVPCELGRDGTVLLDWCANEVSDLLVQLTHFLLHFFRIFLRTQNGLHRDERARSSTDAHF